MTFKLDLETVLAAALVVMVVTGTPGAGFVDCNGNGERDDRDIFFGTSDDCNGNGVPDECDLTAGTSEDCDASDVPDECELDCNGNGLHDSCDVTSGFSEDCNSNGVPDSCDTNVEFDLHALHGYHQGVSSRGVDIDGDGDLDVISSTETVIGGVITGTYWYENGGAGTFEPARLIDDDGWGVLSSADLDNDGDADILQNHYGDLFWHENLGGGDFGPRHQVQIENPAWSWILPVVPVDLDGDDDQDLLHILSHSGSNSPPNSLVWYENLAGQSQFGPAQVLYTGDGAPLFADAADLDGDGDQDAVCGYLTQLVWYDNDGSGSFTPHTVDSTQGVRSVFLDDIDGDGDKDILAAGANPGGKIFWYENLDGAGTFSPAKSIDDDVTGILASLADLDGDGDLDVAAASVDIDWYENLDGRGTFGPKTVMGEVLTVNYDQPFSGDFDLDGDLDVLHGTASFWLENLSDDCNGNKSPDDCEADCNLNGIVDECDLRARSSMDCDYNAIPDECHAGCLTCNADEDVCLDEHDCLPGDASVWSDPTAAANLRLWGDTPTWLTWQRPAFLGTTSVRYNTLRSNSPTDFLEETLCLESDGTDTFSEDGDEPDGGEVFYYLIHVESECPGGAGTMGTDSSGVPRFGKECF